MMLETARWIANCKPDAIKIHMLHILQGTQMALQFFNEKFSLLSIEDICGYRNSTIGSFTTGSDH